MHLQVVEASLNSLEFELREFNTGGFPRGLSYMLGSMNEWIYDRDPVEAMRFEKPLAELRARLAQGEPVFQDLISRLIINNGHRVTVTSLPDTTLEQQILEREKAELEAVRAKLSEAEIATLVDETQTLKRRQQAAGARRRCASRCKRRRSGRSPPSRPPAGRSRLSTTRA